MGAITLGSLLARAEAVAIDLAEVELRVTAALKLCTDCKYIATNGSGTWQHYRCNAPKNPFKINLVTGDKMHTTPFCQEVRETESLCGQDGNWYEYYERPVFKAPISAPVNPVSTPSRRKSSSIPTAEEL